MQRVNRHCFKWRNASFFIIGLLIVVADQLSKAGISSTLIQGHTLFDIGFFRIIHTHNTGAAFGLFQGYSDVLKVISTIGVSVVLLCALLARHYFPVVDNMLGMAALGLIFGGTLGNLIDRFRQGYVTDFIDFSFWPTFNIADSAVTIGVIILVYSLLRQALAEER